MTKKFSQFIFKQMHWIFEKTNVETPKNGSSTVRRIKKNQDPDVVADAAFSYVIRAKRRLMESLQPEVTADELVKLAVPHCEVVAEAYEALENELGDRSIQRVDHYTRHQLHSILAPQHIVLPALFKYSSSDRTSQLERETAMEGMYEKLVDFADDLRAEGQENENQSHQGGQRTAMLHELAFLGIINRPENGEQCALPAFFLERLSECDVQYFGYGEQQTYIMLQRNNSPRRPQGQNAIVLPRRLLGTSCGSEPWHSSQMFGTLAAMSMELDGLGSDAATQNGITALEGLDLIRNVVTHEITLRLEEW